MKKKHVVIGVSGGIAAYKACDLVSKLSKKDYEIKVVMTKHAQEFVKPINFESLSKHKCEVSLFDETNEDPIAHITLASVPGTATGKPDWLPCRFPDWQSLKSSPCKFLRFFHCNFPFQSA